MDEKSISKLELLFEMAGFPNELSGILDLTSENDPETEMNHIKEYYMEEGYDVDFSGTPNPGVYNLNLKRQIQNA